MQTSVVQPSRAIQIIAMAGLVFVSGAVRAHAQTALPVSLAYSASVRCPDEATFVELVAARLGREPFAEDGEARVEVSLRREGQRFIGALEWVRDGMAAHRELESSVSCEEAAESLAMLVAVALDDTPEPVAEMPPELPVREPTLPTPEAAPVVDDEPVPPPSIPIAGFLALAPTLAFGGGVDWTLGGRVEGGVGIGPVWLGLELTAETQPGARLLAEGASAELSLFFAGASACVKIDVISICVLGGGGGLAATVHGVDMPRAHTSGMAFIGGRFGVTIPLPGAFFLRPQIEAVGMVLRSAIAAGDIRLWEASPVAGRIGIAFGVELR